MDTFSLSGLGVAMITPFDEDNNIDFKSLDKLLDLQLTNGKTDFLVVLGTTAETPTLTPDERSLLCRHVVNKVNGKLPLVLGLGGNNTAEIIKEIQNTDLTGFSALLTVVPFYNKPTQEGLYRHYKSISDISPLPIILYNVPGRTGCNMKAATTLRIATDCKNVIGIKEASGDIAQIEEIIKNAPAGFNVISGDDGMTLPLLALGATGVISVIGNAFPADFGTMIKCVTNNDYKSARQIHYRLFDLLRLLFADGNPGGIKCVLNKLGICRNALRLPLVKVSEQTESAITAAIKKYVERIV